MVLVPDATVTIGPSTPASTDPSDSGVGFMVGLCERGTTTGNLKPGGGSASLSDWLAKHGPLTSYNANEYACVEGFFANGGRMLYFSRRVGPAAIKASAPVPATSSQLTATAKGPGASYNTLSVNVTGGVITVKDGAVIVEVSPALASVADAVTWSQTISKYIDLAPLATGALTNTTGDITLTGGADDRVNATSVQTAAALARFGKDLGIGQVGLCGDYTTAAQAALDAHCTAFNREAVKDPADTVTAATVAAVATAARALPLETARRNVVLGDWLTYPPVTVGGLARTVPPSGSWMGMCARNDAVTHPNTSIAGPDSADRIATGVHYTRTASDLQLFADSGVIGFIVDEGRVQPGDDITPVDGNLYPQWWEVSSNRMVMRIVADAQRIAKSFLWKPVSGSVDYLGYQVALTGMLARWKNDGALYGDNPSDAYRVDTGANVNTPATIQAKKLRAAMSLHLAQNVRNAEVLLTNTPLTEAV